MFNNKIQFHNIKNFSSQVRFGKADNIALNRIHQLKESMDNVTSLIEEATQNNEPLKIISNVQIIYSKNKE